MGRTHVARAESSSNQRPWDEFKTGGFLNFFQIKYVKILKIKKFFI